MSFWETVFYCIVYGWCVPCFAKVVTLTLVVVSHGFFWRLEVQHPVTVRWLDACLCAQASKMALSAGLTVTSEGSVTIANGWHLAYLDASKQTQLVACYRSSTETYHMYSLAALNQNALLHRD
jgi:nitrogen fixation protein